MEEEHARVVAVTFSYSVMTVSAHFRVALHVGLQSCNERGLCS